MSLVEPLIDTECGLMETNPPNPLITFDGVKEALSSTLNSVSISEDANCFIFIGSSIYIGRKDGKIRIVDQNLTHSELLIGHTDVISSIKSTHDHSHVVSASKDSTLRI